MDTKRYQIVRGGRVLDAESPDAPQADILIGDGSIMSVGPPGLAAPHHAVVVDASGMLLMPGLINAHTHGHGSLSKGTGDRWSLELLLNSGPWISGQRTLEDKYLAALLNGIEMLFKGCTAAYDLYFEFPVPSVEGLDAVARGYRDAGVRAVIAPMMQDLNLYQAIPGLMDSLPAELRSRVERFQVAPYEESAAAAESILRQWAHDRDFVRPALGPTQPLHCSDPFIERCRALAEDYDVGIHMHLAESRTQAVTAMRRYGATLTGHLRQLNFLSPRFVGAHGIWLDPDDIAMLADHGCAIAHNPGANLRLGSGVAPVRELVTRGVTVGIGTDGTNSSDHQNMFDALRLATNVSRITNRDYKTWVSAPEAVRMATQGSARLLGFADRLGRIAPGFRADIVFLDLAGINFVPLNNPMNQLVNCEDSSSVHSVMVDGEMVLHARRPTRIDYTAMRAKIVAATERLRSVNEDARRLALALEDLVGSYCIGLNACPYHVHRTVGDCRYDH